jgi:hypothetical protein
MCQLLGTTFLASQCAIQSIGVAGEFIEMNEPWGTVLSLRLGSDCGVVQSRVYHTVGSIPTMHRVAFKLPLPQDPSHQNESLAHLPLAHF